jgi:hypothetical protein
MNLSKNQELRTVNILFDAYGEHDPEFKIELIRLMIGDIAELQDAAVLSFESGYDHHFRTTVHKTKSTIKLLDDTEFMESIDHLKELFTTSTDITRDAIASFGSFAGSIIKSLEFETQRLKAG